MTTQKEKILYWTLFVLILVAGITIRVARFPYIPPGLNQDEANSGYESFSLATTGKDKWGNVYPAYFPSWGSGQSVLMAYLSVPVVKVFGLTIFSTRLVPVLLGILTLPLFFFCLRPWGRYASLLGLLLVAIVPWHFMMSRWALECNLAPFFMLLGCGTLLKALLTQQKKWIIVSLVPFAFALYSYGVTIIVLAVFFLLIIAMHHKLIYTQLRSWLIACAVFLIISFPFILFFLKNYILKENLAWTDHLFFSTPICPMNRLYQADASALYIFQHNIGFLFSGCNDRANYNLLSGFHLLVPLIIPLSFIGIICGLYTFFKQRRQQTVDAASITVSVFIAWVVASLVLVFPFELNINRFNHFFLPCMALAVWMISLIPSTVNNKLPKYSIRIVIVLLIVAESVLAIRYYFSDYPDSTIKAAFHSGLEDAFVEVKKLPMDQIRITNRMMLSYVYTIFYLQYPADQFQAEANYEIRNGEYKVNRVGKYIFYDEYLDKKKTYGYLSRKNEYEENENQHKTIVYTNDDWEVGIINSER